MVVDCHSHHQNYFENDIQLLWFPLSCETYANTVQTHSLWAAVFITANSTPFALPCNYMPWINSSVKCPLICCSLWPPQICMTFQTRHLWELVLCRENIMLCKLVLIWGVLLWFLHVKLKLKESNFFLSKPSHSSAILFFQSPSLAWQPFHDVKYPICAQCLRLSLCAWYKWSLVLLNAAELSQGGVWALVTPHSLFTSCSEYAITRTHTLSDTPVCKRTFRYNLYS